MMNTEAKCNLLNKSAGKMLSQADDDDSIADTNDYVIKMEDSRNEDDSIADSNNVSAKRIGYNADLLIKIFVCLPAKSIVRFKSVSKQWLSLLTQPRFTLLFDKLCISSGLYYHELHVSYDVTNPTTPPFRTIDFYPDNDGIRIVQSCNGLLLCRCDTDEYEYDGNGNYYVFNPTTKESALIPPVIGSPSAKSLIRFMGLAYHPTECVHYKLVCILRAGHTERGQQGFDEDGNRMYNIQIYFSRTRKWKKLKKQTFTPSDYTEFRYGVYWNRAFYWGPTCPNPMYLSLDDEKIQELPLPSTLLSVRHDYLPLYFGESRGHLHLVAYSHEKNPSSLNVYEMLRDHSGWFIKYQLDLHRLFAKNPKMTHTRRDDKYEFRVLDVVRGDEEDEDTFMVVKVVDNIKRYNILDKNCQELCDIPNNIEEVEACFSKAFGKTFHPFVGHRYIEKIGSF